MSGPVIIVGTGRCGSTLLSNMLHEHPQILSLSEFYGMVAMGGLARDALDPEAIDGVRFWQIIAANHPQFQFFLRHGIVFSEWLYPYDDPAARYSRTTGVPAILLTTLPHLTNDHEQLFDQLQNEVAKWPVAPLAEHYRHLFDWLAGRFGKAMWIERSGATLTYVDRLYSLFPDARFVHVVRDGRDTALSIQEHLGLRVATVQNEVAGELGTKPFAALDRNQIDRLPPGLRRLVFEDFDIEAFKAYRSPLAICGSFWSQQIVEGLDVMQRLPADKVMTLRYEDLFVDPRQQLDRLAVFIGKDFVDRDWSERCAATIRPPRATWRDLCEDEARMLTQACQPGFDALQAIGVEYQLS